MIFRSVAEVKSRDSNEQIGEWNDAADFPGFRIDLSGKLSHLLRKRLKRKDRKSTRLNSSHSQISYAVFCLKKKKWFDLLISPSFPGGFAGRALSRQRRFLFECFASLSATFAPHLSYSSPSRVRSYVSRSVY